MEVSRPGTGTAEVTNPKAQPKRNRCDAKSRRLPLLGVVNEKFILSVRSKVNQAGCHLIRGSDLHLLTSE
jgi:hypothetical protein